MAAPRDLSIAEIRNFMIANGGRVTNHELVKHFRHFLTNPNTKGECSFAAFRSRYHENRGVHFGCFGSVALCQCKVKSSSAMK